MALDSSSYQTKLALIAANLGATPDIFAKDFSSATALFWKTGQGPGGSTLQTDACATIMQPDFLQAAAVFATPDLFGNVMAQGIFKGAQAIIGTGGIYGVHIATIPAPPIDLGSQIASLVQSHPPSYDIFAQRMAAIVKTYTSLAVMNGTGITPAPPVTGNIS